VVFVGGGMKKPEIKKNIWPVSMAAFLIFLIIGIFLLPDGKDSMSFNGLILVIAAIYVAYILFAAFESERDDFNPFSDSMKKAVAIMIFVTAAALILRVMIGLAVPGYPADMSCWTAWSQAAAGGGLFSAYENTTFLDYPPGYLYILHILGSLGNMLGIECGSSSYNLLLKIPAILADLGMSWILFGIGKREKNIKLGLLIAVLYAINPLTILNSAAWGQIDSILTLAVAGYFILLHRKRIFAATLVFVAGLLLKPQMLFFGPVLAVVFIKHLSEDGVKAGLKTFLLSFTGGAALFVITVLPFSISKEWTWILDKYMGTINSYPYATLNAANVFGMLKLNWQSLETILWGLKLSTWGMIGLAFSVTVYFIIAFMNKRKENIFILS
jgi:Gpi18-like mannosyltransferase